MTTLQTPDQQLAELRGKVLSLPRIDDWRTLSLPPNVGLWEWRPQNSQVRFSSEWCRLLGFGGIDGSVGLHEYVQHVHPDDRAFLTLTMVGFVVAGGEYVSRHRMMHGDGSERRFLSRDVAVLPGHGYPAHVVVADIDLIGASC